MRSVRSVKSGNDVKLRGKPPRKTKTKKEESFRARDEGEKQVSLRCRGAVIVRIRCEFRATFTSQWSQTSTSSIYIYICIFISHSILFFLKLISLLKKQKYDGL